MLVVLCAEIEEAQKIKCSRALTVITGAGMCNALKIAGLHLSPNDTIINVGYVGSNKYSIGSVVAVDGCKRFVPSITMPEPTIRFAPIFRLPESDLCYTADNFIEGEFDKELPLVDMELYYYASIYPQIKSIKIVSDNLNYSDYTNVNFEESWDFVNEIINNL